MLLSRKAALFVLPQRVLSSSKKMPKRCDPGSAVPVWTQKRRTPASFTLKSPHPSIFPPNWAASTSTRSIPLPEAYDTAALSAAPITSEVSPGRNKLDRCVAVEVTLTGESVTEKMGTEGQHCGHCGCQGWQAHDPLGH